MKQKGFTLIEILIVIAIIAILSCFIFQYNHLPHTENPKNINQERVHPKVSDEVDNILPLKKL